METLMQNMSNYLNALDWMYILTFILIAYVLNYFKITAFITQWTGITIKTRYRVFLIGLLYGIVIYFVRGYQVSEVEILFASFMFALVFHKLLLELLLHKILPQSPKNLKKPKNPKSALHE